MFDLTGKAALVTGASGGIGGAIATALHAQGAQVALSGTREGALGDLAGALGARTHTLPCDLSDATQAAAPATFYIEYHTNMMQPIMSHAVSLIVEGAFRACPNLRVVLIEGGVAWVPGLLWRLDKNWRGCRMEIPWVERAPSEIFAEHFRLTTQPSEEPADPAQLLQIFEMIDAENLLLFATDYPHWDFDAPNRSLPAGLSEDARTRILSTKASELYRFA